MNILVIDDHPLVREAVVNVVRRLDAVADVVAVRDCEQGLAAAADRGEPDLVMLDLDLPGLRGLDALDAWRTRHPSVAVIVLSADEQPSMVSAALAAGAAGYIPKSTPSEVMLGAVRLVLDGGRYLPPLLLQGGAHPMPQPTSAQPATALAQSGPAALRALGLTERQTDVLRLLARGVPNKVIARELGLAERTVKAHVTAILRATGLNGRTQIALQAARLGLVDGPPNHAPPGDTHRRTT